MALSLVLVLDLAGRGLLQGDRQVVPGGDFNHRRRVLAVCTLAERVVVGVDLARTLGGDYDGRVVRIDVIEELVDTWLDHRRLSLGTVRHGQDFRAPRPPSARRRSRSRGGTPGARRAPPRPSSTGPRS